MAKRVLLGGHPSGEFRDAAVFHEGGQERPGKRLQILNDFMDFVFLFHDPENVFIKKGGGRQI